MTTESAPAPHTSQATAVHRSASSIHPPRSVVRRGTAPPGPHGISWRGSVMGLPAAGLFAADLLAVALALSLVPGVHWPQLAFALLAAVLSVLHTYRGLYRPGLSPSALGELPALLGLGLLQWYGTAEVLTAYDSRYAVDGTALACAIVVQSLLACTGRAVVHLTRRACAARRPQPALVVGRGPVAQQVTAALYDHAGYGLRPVGQVDPGHVDPGHVVPQPDTAQLPVLATPEDVSRAVIQNDVRHAVFTRPPESAPEAAALVGLFAEHGCRLWLVDGGAAEGITHRRVQGTDHLWGFAVQPLHSGPHQPFARTGKRAMDAVLAAAALLVAAPVMAVCALAVRLFDGPGVIFRQERIGLDGRPFVLLKFRTLCPVDEHESATRWSVALDRRMSFTGNLLRRTSLDELPQLWNVLRGDMSLVGPRPERPYFVAKFSHAHPGYQARHRMPVGITGLAQVNGLRGDTSIEDRARFDNHYIETWSLWQDVCILARTAGSLFRFGGS
ncbi:exopolysaccharide biosynthesis polyprenyl glycosylphosphotransferase [Streptomyces sp. NBC_01142]|uniref:exopolysaccharide biosynthesis polyprenyl glycosylphosphotransferase n=1 Tax=Streptomyces sp. NBC_01142 TaxID=2975865 RepID=UPI00225ADBAA|nr:exopolysaccharide biosynthesis polyprenyl glycosylphosphotransferase [Streptomyces sp. NBC_01142]MCX4819042.1 exopolysaccharide biosynthesis polyprenyl glycosylphosphotransferase [Streptomyces sp. NBC_01142]